MSKEPRALDTSGPAGAPAVPGKDEILPSKSRQIDYAHPHWGNHPTTGAQR